jgi:hypothetical protein
MADPRDDVLPVSDFAAYLRERYDVPEGKAGWAKIADGIGLTHRGGTKMIERWLTGETGPSYRPAVVLFSALGFLTEEGERVLLGKKAPTSVGASGRNGKGGRRGSDAQRP